MIMFKKKILVVFFLLTSIMWYEAIYSKKNSVNYGFSISSLNFIGDRDVNLKINRTLNNYSQIKIIKNLISI